MVLWFVSTICPSICVLPNMKETWLEENMFSSICVLPNMKETWLEENTSKLPNTLDTYLVIKVMILFKKKKLFKLKKNVTYVCMIYILAKFKAPRRMTEAGCVRATGSARFRSVM